MKTKILINLCLLCIIFVSSCTKDKSLCVRAFTGNDSIPVRDVEVKVQKKDDKLVYGRDLEETYYGTTDSLGFCCILIEDYDDEEYTYDIDVNEDLQGNLDSINFPDYNESVFSHWATSYLSADDFDSVINARLSRILIPDYEGVY